MDKKGKILDRRFVPAGQIVIEQGNFGNRAFLIESGKLEVFMIDRKGRDVKLAEAGPGDIVGEMALLDGGKRSASIRTVENSVLIAISPQDVHQSIGDPRGIFAQMMRVMVERLKDTNAQLIKQNMELADIEEAAQLTVENISLHIPENKQTAFKREVVPLLDKLKSTLQKYNHI